MKKASATTKPAADVGRVPSPGISMADTSAPAGDSRPATTMPQGDPAEQPYPGYAREAAALQAKVAAARRSQAAPLPGALREAFAGEPRRVLAGGHTHTLQPVCAWLAAILVRIQSPLIEIIRIWRGHSEELASIGRAPSAGGAAEQIAALEKKIHAQIQAEVKPSPDTAMETVFAFVTPVEQCQELLDVSRQEFTFAARKLLGKLHPLELGKLERACGEHYSSSFATALSVSVAPPGQAEGEVFTTPPPAPTTTASAGGSNSSAP